MDFDFVDEDGLVSWAPDGHHHLAVGLNEVQTQRSRVGSMEWIKQILSTAGMNCQIMNNYVSISNHFVETYRGHHQKVCGLKWSDSGQQLASGGNDNLLHIWDRSVVYLNSPTEWLQGLEDHTAAVKALAWCPFQANLLASGGGEADGSINTHTGAYLNSVDTGSQVCYLLWNKNERELLSSHGFTQNQLTIWKYPSVVKIAELTGHISEVQLWDSTSNRQLRTLRAGHKSRVGAMDWNHHALSTGEVCGLKWSASGQELASGWTDNRIHIWDRSGYSLNTCTQWLHRLEDHNAAVRALAWCPFQANLLPSGGGAADGSVKFWNTHTGACLVKIADLTGYPSRVLLMAQSPDGRTSKVQLIEEDQLSRYVQSFSPTHKWSSYGIASGDRLSRSEGLLPKLTKQTRTEKSILDEEMAASSSVASDLPHLPDKRAYVKTNSVDSELACACSEFYKNGRVHSKFQKHRYKAIQSAVQKLLNQSQAVEFLRAFAGVYELDVCRNCKKESHLHLHKDMSRILHNYLDVVGYNFFEDDEGKCRWPNKLLTFYIDSSVPKEAYRIIAKSLGQWGFYAGLQLTKVAHRPADITFIFKSLKSGDLGLTSCPPEGIVYLNQDQEWYFGDETNIPEGKYDFESTVLHELGHAFGIRHPKENNKLKTMMGPTVMEDELGLGEIRRQLYFVDILAIFALYIF